MKLPPIVVSASTVVVVAMALGACASTPTIITDGRQEARAEGDQAQRTADQLRREGATGAATSAQARADRKYQEANKRPEGFLEWLVDVVFNSWLYSGK